MNDLITLQDLSSLTGLHKSNIVRRKLDDYVVGKKIINGTGRPSIIYHPAVLEVFGITPEPDIPEPRCRKIRSDQGRTRNGIPDTLEQEYIAAVLNEYLNQGARRDVLNCARRAAKSLWCQEFALVYSNPSRMAEHYYKNVIMRNDLAKNPRKNRPTRGTYVGYYHRDNWLLKWEAKWKKKDVALVTQATMRYNILELGESLGLLGPGTGAGTIFWLDDHVSDSFMEDSNRVGYRGSLPKGLYMIDAWTGMFLDYEPGEVNSTMTALMIVRAALKYGLPLVIGLENSKAMKSIRIDRIIEALYPDDLLSQYRSNEHNYWLRVLFETARSPVVRNLPNIPRFLFKARLEAIFKNIKAHDALKYPITYHAGGLDPVQLRLNSAPLQPPASYTPETYEASVREYLSSDYLDKLRPSMFPAFRQKTGLDPTVRNAWAYYGGESNPGTGIKPDPSKIAYLLFWLAELNECDKSTLRKTIVKAHNGRVACILDHKPCWFVAPELNGLKGEKVAIVTIPDSINQAMGNRQVQGTNYDYAALFHLQSGEPKFLAIVKNTYTSDYRELAENRQIVRATRQHYKQLTAAPLPAEQQIPLAEPKPVTEPKPIILPKPAPTSGRLTSVKNNINNLLEL